MTFSHIYGGIFSAALEWFWPDGYVWCNEWLI